MAFTDLNTNIIQHPKRRSGRLNSSTVPALNYAATINDDTAWQTLIDPMLFEGSFISLFELHVKSINIANKYSTFFFIAFNLY